MDEIHPIHTPSRCCASKARQGSPDADVGALARSARRSDGARRRRRRRWVGEMNEICCRWGWEGISLPSNDNDMPGSAMEFYCIMYFADSYVCMCQIGKKKRTSSSSSRAQTLCVRTYINCNVEIDKGWAELMRQPSLISQHLTDNLLSFFFFPAAAPGSMSSLNRESSNRRWARKEEEVRGWMDERQGSCPAVQRINSDEDGLACRCAARRE